MNPTGFYNGFVVSIIIHLALLVLLVMFTFSVPPPKEIEPTIITIKFDRVSESAKPKPYEEEEDNIITTLVDSKPPKRNPTLKRLSQKALKTPLTLKREPQPLPQQSPTAREESIDSLLSRLNQLTNLFSERETLRNTQKEKPTEVNQVQNHNEQIEDPLKTAILEEEKREQERQRELQEARERQLKEIEEEKKRSKLNELSEFVEEALRAEKLKETDPLADASWSSVKRKTLYFPNIESKIPNEYKIKGLSYALTAKIAFNQNGNVVSLDIIKSSGDTVIDGIFSAELRKIRIEAGGSDQIDEIVKTFRISLK